jgi:hypothetical protein
MGADLSNYVEVPDRIKEFYGKYPDGSLQGIHKIVEIGGKTFIEYVAKAYRSPDDKRPGVGTTWEPFPGRTNFTRDSEVENAETSAWGRALAALGFVAKKDGTNGVASANEVRNRQAERDQPQIKDPGSPATEPQRKALNRLLKQAQIKTVDDANRVLSILTGREISGGTLELSKGEASSIMEKLKNGEVPSVQHPSDIPGDGAEFTHPPTGDTADVPFDPVEAVKKGFDAVEEPAG